MPVACSACHAPNRADARFCEDCGSPINQMCRSCGTATDPDKRFCGDCGAALDAPQRIRASPRAAADGELRQATLVALRPLHVGGIDSPHRRRISELIESLEATSFSTTNETQVALFGAQVAQEDHHRRAILFAQGARTAGEDPAAGPSFAIGVATAQVPYQEDSWDDGLAPLAAVLLMSRLAAPGEVLIDAVTARLLRGSVALGPGPADLDEVALADDHLPLFSVTGDLDTRRVVRHRDGRPLSQFVGRSRQTALLHAALSEASAGAGQVVGIVGEAGMGKSRLLEEFRRSVGSAARWIEGRCLAYGRAMPYRPVLDTVRDLCGLSQSDAVAHVRARVVATMHSYGLGVEAAAHILHPLNALDEDARGAIDALSPEATRNRTFEVVRRLLLAAARREPTIVTIEDVHWADDTTTSFLESLAPAVAGVPLLLITTFRPGLRPAWLEHSYATQVALPRLGPADSLHVVQSVVENERISEMLYRSILSRAEGNPFFLEELALATAEAIDVDDGSVPETVQGVLMARIDRLPEISRRVLQTASVLGREFLLRLLEAVWAGPGPAGPHLDLLAREEFLVEATVDGRPGFEFKHALTHDVAYHSIPASRRRALHEAAGLAMEELYAGRVDEAYEVLAHHWSRTDDSQRAVGYLRRAADAAGQRYAHNEAAAALHVALRHARSLPDDERDQVIVELTLQRVRSLYFLGDMEGSAGELDALASQVEQLGDSALIGSFNFWVAHTSSHLGDHARAAGAVRTALAMGRSRADDAAAGRALYILCREGWWTGKFRDGIAHGEDAVPLLSEAGESWWLGHCHFFIAHSLYSLGDFDLALQAAERGGVIGEAVADPRLRSWAAWARGLYEAARGNADIGVRECARGVEISPDGPNTAWALGALGFARREAGDLETAIDDLTEAIELARRTRHPGIVARFQGWLAETYLRGGSLDRAEETAREAFAQASGTGCPWVAALSQRTLGRILAERGDRPGARRVLGDARAGLEAIGCSFDLALAEMDLARLARLDGRDPVPSLRSARTLLADVPAPLYRERLDALARTLGCPDEVPAGVGRLTAREREVLALITEGLSNKEIAARLVISQNTAIRHVANIFAKLGVSNRTAAARAAVELDVPTT